MNQTYHMLGLFLPIFLYDKLAFQQKKVATQIPHDNDKEPLILACNHCWALAYDR